MARSLFFGADATDSIIPLVQATDSKLITLSNNRNSRTNPEYSPWMAIPQGMLQSDLDCSWLPTNRLTQRHDHGSIQKIFKCINLENDLIPSHENYDLRISDLNSDEIEIFNSRILEAEYQLKRILPHFETLISNLIRKYIPIETPNRTHGDTGMSTLWFKGAIFFESNQRANLDQRTENLAHEIAHQIIINYQLNDTLIASDLNQEIYSGIRATNRPAILAFHAAAALSYMLWIQSTLGNHQRASLLSSQLKSTLADLEKVKTTLIGRKIMDEFHLALHSFH
jgi:hypothetical protein